MRPRDVSKFDMQLHPKFLKGRKIGVGWVENSGHSFESRDSLVLGEEDHTRKMGRIKIHSNALFSLFVEFSTVVIYAKVIVVVSMPILASVWDVNSVAVLTTLREKGLGTEEPVG